MIPTKSQIRFGYEPRSAWADLRRLLSLHASHLQGAGQAMGARGLRSDSVPFMTGPRRTTAEPDSRPVTDEDGVLLPRLRFKDVVARGGVQGVAAVALLCVATPFIADHHDRETFLAVVAGFSMVFAGVGVVIGGFFWTACAGDIRRWRDWRTITGQTGGVMIMAPVLVRSGFLALVLFPGALGLYHLVDNAAYDSWLYGS